MLRLDRFRKARHTARTELPADADGAEPERQGPELMLLVSDAASRSGLRLHRFPDAESAAAFIEFWFPPEHRHGLIAFWALSETPEAEPAAEFALLVSDPSLPGIVRPLSFPDEGSALSSLVREMADGLDPSQVLACWARPVAVSTGPAGEARLSPVRPPVSRSAPATGREPEALPEPETVAPAPVLPWRRLRRLGVRIDLLEEARKVLRTERWRVRREAFQGFGSPPGRF